MARAILLLTLAVWPSVALGDEFLLGEPRAIPLGDSASRDAPVVEIAYGPTLQASVGGELGLVLRRRPLFDYRLSVYGLAAYEMDVSSYPPPQFLRTLFGLTFAFAWPAPPVMGGLFEASLGLGAGLPTTLGGTAIPTATDGIPFGGGGAYLLPGVAWRRDFAGVRSTRWRVTVRVNERVDIATLVLAVGQTSVADVIADTIGDGLTNEPSVDCTFRWLASNRWQPLVSLHGDVLFPWDPEARVGFFVRGILGVAFTGRGGELIPFLSANVGNGQGYLINEQSVRFSLGVRYAPP